MGRSGIKSAKREGDGATPAGEFHPVRLWWRADRAQAPACWSRCRCLQRMEVGMRGEKEPRPQAGPARIMIVDDHALAREGLRAMLAHQHDLAVVAEAVDAGEARALCRRVVPDLLLMDVRMPGMDGLAATAAIKQEFPAIRVIIITMYENPDYLLQAIRAGAAAYLLKNATAREVLTAVRQVLRGEFPLRPRITSTGLLRQSSTRRCQLDILVVVAAAEKILSLR